MADFSVLRRNDDGTIQEVASFPAADATSLNIRANGWETLFDGAIPAEPAGGNGTPQPGPSAYDVACTNGFVGTQVQWLASLKGEPGANGAGTVSQGDFTAAVQAAFAGDYTLDWRGGDVALAAPIVLSLTQWRFAFGIRLNGAKVSCSFTTQPAITIIVPVVGGAVVQNVGMRNFTMSDGHFTGGYGALRLECRSNGSWLGLGNISNLTVDGHSGYGIEALGSVFEGEVARVTTSNGLGGFHARTCGLVEPDPTGADHDKGLPSALYVTMPDFRDGTGDGILLSASTPYQEPFDLTVENGYVVTGAGVGIRAPSGINCVEGVGFENLNGGAAISLGYRGGVVKRCRGANPIANATISPPHGMAYLVDCALSGGLLIIEDCSVQNENAGSGVKLARVNGSGKVYLNRSGATIDGTGPTVVVQTP